MSTINLKEIVHRWMITYGGGMINASPKFSALKLELSDVSWSGQKRRLAGKTRSFEMSNTSPAQGTGHLETVKEGRPVTIVTITSGVLQGYPKWTALGMPEEIWPDVGKIANVEIGQTITQRVETSMLKVDAEVSLASQARKYATVENEDIEYHGTFSGTAKLSGNVLFENVGQIPVVQIFNDMHVPDVIIHGLWTKTISWSVSGKLRVNFEDNQTLLLS